MRKFGIWSLGIVAGLIGAVAIYASVMTYLSGGRFTLVRKADDYGIVRCTLRQERVWHAGAERLMDAMRCDPPDNLDVMTFVRWTTFDLPEDQSEAEPGLYECRWVEYTDIKFRLPLVEKYHAYEECLLRPTI